MKKQIMALGLTGLIGLGGLGLLTNKSFADTSNKPKGNTTVAQGLDKNAMVKDTEGKKMPVEFDQNTMEKDVVEK